MLSGGVVEIGRSFTAFELTSSSVIGCVSTSSGPIWLRHASRPLLGTLSAVSARDPNFRCQKTPPGVGSRQREQSPVFDVILSPKRAQSRP